MQAPTSTKQNQATRLAHLRKMHNKTIREVGEYIGRAPSQVLRYESVAKANIRDVAEKLAKLYKVTTDYILFGEDGPPQSVVDMRRQVEQLGIKSMSEQPVRYRTDDIEVIFARRVPVTARATFAENLTDDWDGGEDSYEEVPIQSPTVELRRKGTIVIEVDGDSMEPTLMSGWSVACYKIPKSDFKYLPSGLYGIVFGNFFVIKRIKDNDILRDGTLTLHSDNERGGMLTVPAEELRGIWKVVKVTDGLLH